MATIPLFPLNAIVFPKGRLSLQIFEARYLDMISSCLRKQSGFGVVLIKAGQEVARPGMTLELHRTGTYCEVVDWNQLPNGLLGITAEGRKTFEIRETWRRDNDLNMAQVSFREQDAVDAAVVDVGDDFREYVDLLEGLARHPAVEELNLDMNLHNLREVAWRLSELLPVSQRDKQALLELDEPADRLRRIEDMLATLNH